MPPYPQSPLFPAPVEDAYIRLHFEVGRGWLVSTSERRAGETWGEAESHLYELLSADEAETLLFAVVGGLLGTV